MLALALLLAASPVTVSTWHVIGPFESGSREGQVHPLAEADGSLPATWDFERTWPSALTDGGRVAWTTVDGEVKDGVATGVVKLDEKADWDAREKEWGPAGVANVAVLVGSFDLPDDALLVVDAARCGGTIDGQPFSGDPYGADVARSVVRGRRGSNEVVLLSSTLGGEREVTFRVEPVAVGAPPLRIIESDVRVPDRVAGVAGKGWAGIPLLNVTDRWLDVDVVLGPERSHVRLAPMSPLKIAMPVSWPASPADPAEVPLEIVASAEGRAVTATAKMAVRPAGEPWRETFLSRIDGSAQEYGVRPSRAGDEPGQSLILSTHGAAVDALGQVRAYGPKDRTIVVAPLNRRPFGFDWQDWGRLDFEEVHDLAIERFHPDPDRVHLSGHSMGGHGAWLLGALHADEFATVGPSAGWSSYDTYIPYTARRSTWLGSADVQSLVLRGLGTARVSSLLENLVGVPVQVLHGGKDDNVPPTQARMLTGLLERLGGKVTYVEAPTQGHWSDLDLGRPGSDSVDPAIMDRFWSQLRDRWPRHVVFVTPDPDVDPVRWWLRLDRQERCATDSRLEASVEGNGISVQTRNVDALSVLFAPDLGLTDGATLTVDGDAIAPVVPDGSWVALARGRDGRWQRARRDPGTPTQPNLRPGGLAKALFTPFAIVLPTQGDAARCQTLASVARAVATSWWVRGNGYAPIVRDVDVDAALRKERGLLLVGGPDVNAETARIARSLKMVATAQDGARLGASVLPGPDLACAHWQPSPDAPERRVLVLQATSPASDLLLASLQPIAPGLGLPDFVAASPRIRVAGFAGFTVAGYWSPDWEVEAGTVVPGSRVEGQPAFAGRHVR